MRYTILWGRPGFDVDYEAKSACRGRNLTSLKMVTKLIDAKRTYRNDANFAANQQVFAVAA